MAVHSPTTTSKKNPRSTWCFGSEAAEKGRPKEKEKGRPKEKAKGRLKEKEKGRLKEKAKARSVQAKEPSANVIAAVALAWDRVDMMEYEIKRWCFATTIQLLLVQCKCCSTIQLLLVQCKCCTTIQL